LGFYYR